MPVSFVSKDNEKEWEEAKSIAKERFGSEKDKGFWPFTNWMFHKLIGKPLSEAYTSSVVKKEHRHFPTKFESVWKETERYISRHPVYSTMTEDEKSDLAESIFTNHNSDEKIEYNKLLEYINTYGNTGNGGWTGGMGNISPYGGGRTEAPRGPIVYGFPEPPSPLNTGGYAGAGGYGTVGEPAIVNIPPKESNYEPWKTQLDSNGNVISDIDRAQQSTETQDKLDGPLGDLLLKLEDSGLDLDKLNSMSEEEIEDEIIKAVKKDKANSATEHVQQRVQQAGTLSQKLQEAFSFSEQDMIDEAKREKGSIPKARELLAARFGVKNAMEKDDNGRKYVIDRNAIEKMMRQHGLNYNSQLGRWVEKDGKEPSGEVKPMTAQEPEASAEDTTEDRPEFIKKVPVPGDNNPLHNIEFKAKVKDYEARYILGLGHDDELATMYSYNDQTKQYIPQIPPDQILAKIELLKYLWNDDKLIWLNNQMTLPNAVFANGEDRKIVSGRAILSATDNDPKWIQLNDEMYGTESITEVMAKLEILGYEWSDDAMQWSWTKPTAAVVPVNESVLLEALSNRNNNNSILIKKGEARFLYDLDVANNGEPHDQMQDILKRGATADTEKDKNITVDDAHVENYLNDKKYKYNNKIKMWTDEHDLLPRVLDDSGETESSFIGRGYLYANGDKGAIQVEPKTGTRQAIPRRKADGIINDMESMNYSFDDQENGVGWVSQDEKQAAEKQKTDSEKAKQADAIKNSKVQTDQAKAVADKAKQDAANAVAKNQADQDRILNADYSILNSEQKKQYDDLLLKKTALQKFGLAEWPKDPAEGNKLEHTFRKAYKRVIDPVTNKKQWLERGADMGSLIKDENPIMRAVKKIGGRFAKGAGAGLTGLGSLLWHLGKY